MQKIVFNGIGIVLMLALLPVLGHAESFARPDDGLAAALTPGTVSPLSDTICPYGDPVAFTSQPATGGTGTVTYQWQFQPGCAGPWTDIPGATSLSYDPPPGLSASTCFRLTATDNLTTVFSDSLQVVVRPGPNASLSPDGLPVTCQGDSVLFIASGGGSYTWTYNNQPFAFAGDSLWAVQPGDYTVVVTDAFGCRDTSQTYALTWYPPSTVSISASGTAAICPGDTLPLLSQVIGNAGNYQWLLDGMPVPGATGPTHPAVSSGSYQLQVSDANGCPYLSDTLPVVPGDPPQAVVFPPADTLVCGGHSLPLTGSGAGTFQWLLNGLPVPGAVDSVYDATAGGDYALVVTNGCGADTSGAVTLTASPGPVAAFDYENYDLDEVLFFNESSNAVAWFWDLGRDISREEFIYYGFPGPGAYPVTLTVWDSLGCADSITLTVSVQEPDFFVANVFSPNDDGVNDRVRTRFDRLNAIEFCIFDRWGRKMFVTHSPNDYWDGTVSGKPAPEGVYFYQFRGLDIRGELISDSGNITLVR